MAQDVGSDSERDAKWKRSVNFSCIHFLRKVLWRQGAASNDIVDSLAAELTEKIFHWSDWCENLRGDAEIVSRAIQYLAEQHDGPWRGVDWFVNSIQLLIQLAVPENVLDENSVDFLYDVQQGISQSIQTAPIRKEELRITDSMAKQIKLLQEAGCEYGAVSDLLELVESVFHGERLEGYQKELLLVAATAAPFVRVERIERKIDKLD
ncbi:hypothetical protein PMI16_01842 [Herbaspirillum sp. CF444]|uniref:hypothetical protein n=1 Tax=Herbaspirillum sp. CF444 TaxID=1144319 RepID=UPI00027239FB|nr:hypothetical protein [Herbaspirillum sp. CF444]EJL90444.1 hypothetical protein PMI16_01842 [Herbaspirillum sp. CF444]